MAESDDAATDEPFVWRGIVDPELMYDDVVSASHQLADAAQIGDWSTVFDMLDDPERRVDINWWRPGGKAWFTVLHQAAWHGAPTEVAAELIRRGALRSLTDVRGRTAYDVRHDRDLAAGRTKDVVAQQRKSLVLRTRYLRPEPSPVAPSVIRALDWHLGDVIDSRIRGVLYGGSPALAHVNANMDIFTVVTAAAKRAATEFIESQRGTAELVGVNAKGTSRNHECHT